VIRNDRKCCKVSLVFLVTLLYVLAAVVSKPVRGLSQSSVSASDVVQNTHVSIEEAEELLSAFQKCGGKPIGLEDFKKLLLEVQHLYDSPAFSPDAADLYFRIFDTAHDGLIDPCEFVVGCSIVATGNPEQKAELVFKSIDRQKRGYFTWDDLAIHVDNMLNVGEKLFTQKALSLIPVRLGAAHEYKMRFKEMRKKIREDMLNKTFAVGSAGRVTLQEWINAAKANNEAVNSFIHPYEPLQEIVDTAVAEIHRELMPKDAPDAGVSE